MLEFFKSKLFFKHLGIALSCLALLLFGLFLFLSSYTLHGKTIAVPKLEGLTMDKAEALIAESKLRVAVVDSVFNDDVPGGTVIDQNPTAGFNVKLNRTVYLTINSFNPPYVRMPNLIDKSLRQAEATLESYGLKMGNTSYIPDFAKDAVIKQKYKSKEIKVGTEIRRGAKIDLVLGDGLKGEKVSVPMLIGLNLSEAHKKILAASLSLGGKIYDLSVKDSSAARVYKQNPEFGNEMNMGMSVDLFFTEDNTKIEMPADTSREE